MKGFLFSIHLLCFSLSSAAQDKAVKDLKKDAEKIIRSSPNDTAVKTWKKGGNFNLNVNQGTLSNWSAGGEKFSFSLNTFLSLYASYKKDKRAWDNSLDLGYGLVKTTSLGVRKASDRIELTSKYGYAITEKLNLASLTNLRTQFAKGYAYDKLPNGSETATVTSRTFLPAYVLLALGIDFKPAESFSLFLSPITGRWIIVGNDMLAPLYGVPEGQNSKDELGAFLSASFNKKINANASFKSKLDLFSNYKSNPENVDIFWTNVLSAKLTKYINFNLNVDLIYDDDTKNVNPEKGPAPQLLQLMGIGFAYQFKN